MIHQNESQFKMKLVSKLSIVLHLDIRINWIHFCNKLIYLCCPPNKNWYTYACIFIGSGSGRAVRTDMAVGLWWTFQIKENLIRQYDCFKFEPSDMQSGTIFISMHKSICSTSTWTRDTFNIIAANVELNIRNGFNCII
jgi:hypothetical protein